MTLLTETLSTSRRILRDLIAAETLMRGVHEPQGRALLERLAGESARELPILAGLIAEASAAEAFDLAQRPAAGPGIDPEEYSHAANDHACTSELPALPFA